MTISKLIHHLQSWQSILGPEAQVLIYDDPPMDILYMGVLAEDGGADSVLLVPCSQVVHSEKE
jgi:hypothetical protein